MAVSFITTSHKGGVGKSTAAVNLAAGLALRGFSVLIVDLDVLGAGIDLLLGCESDVLFNLQDFILDRATFDKIIVPVSFPALTQKFPGNQISAPGGNLNSAQRRLDFVSAPYRLEYGFYDDARFKEFIDAAHSAYDYVVYDCPPGEFTFLDTLAGYVDFAFVISDHSLASVRAADKTADRLLELSVKDIRLIINCFDPRAIIEGYNLGVVDLIDNVRIRLFGIIEYNRGIKNAQQIGLTVFDMKNKQPSYDFFDVIDRMCGKNVLLRRKYSGIELKKLYFTKKK